VTARAVGITVSSLSKKLGTTHALNDVSMQFDTGIMHGLIGPEGAGKTTLLRLIQGLLHPDNGTITYTCDGIAVPLAQIRDRIAYMPQQQCLYGDLSVSEHLDFFRALYRLPSNEYKKKRSELLSVTQMEKFVDRPAGKLSGGMYKKLGLMCALLRNPETILLDEPTNGVDPISRRDFWDLLRTVSQQHILVILATAYMDEATRCERVHLIESGNVLAEGEPKKLLEQEGCATFDAYFIKRQDTSHARG